MTKNISLCCLRVLHGQSQKPLKGEEATNALEPFLVSSYPIGLETMIYLIGQEALFISKQQRKDLVATKRNDMC